MIVSNDALFYVTLLHTQKPYPNIYTPSIHPSSRLSLHSPLPSSFLNTFFCLLISLIFCKYLTNVLRAPALHSLLICANSSMFAFFFASSLHLLLTSSLFPLPFLFFFSFFHYSRYKFIMHNHNCGRMAFDFTRKFEHGREGAGDSTSTPRDVKCLSSRPLIFKIPIFCMFPLSLLSLLHHSLICFQKQETESKDTEPPWTSMDVLVPDFMVKIWRENHAPDFSCSELELSGNPSPYSSSTHPLPSFPFSPPPPLLLLSSN